MKKLIIGLVLMFSMNSCVAQQGFREVDAAKDTIVFSRMIVGDMVDEDATLYTKHYRKGYLVERKECFEPGKEYFFRLKVHQDGTKVRRAKVLWHHITPEQIETDIKDAIKKFQE